MCVCVCVRCADYFLAHVDAITTGHVHCSSMSDSDSESSHYVWILSEVTACSNTRNKPLIQYVPLWIWVFSLIKFDANNIWPSAITQWIKYYTTPYTTTGNKKRSLWCDEWMRATIEMCSLSTGQDEYRSAWTMVSKWYGYGQSHQFGDGMSKPLHDQYNFESYMRWPSSN